MKTLLHLLFVLAFTSTSLADSYPLTDTSGEALQNGGGAYFISPLILPGAPVQLAKIGSETCPRIVVQPFLGDEGIPVRFSSPRHIPHIFPNMRVHVEFMSTPYTCLPSPARWKVDKEDGSVKIVEEGEQTGLFGPFRIEGFNENLKAFKLQYCEDQNDIKCKDIGVSSDHTRRLIVNDGYPLIVRFERAHDPEGIRMTV